MTTRMPRLPSTVSRSAHLIFLTIALLSTPAVAQIHVPGDFLTIQEAINAANPGQTVLVDPGTYTGPLNKNLDYLGKDIEVRSAGGAAVTIIDMEFSGRGVHFHSGETSAAILDGFTITHGFFGGPQGPEPGGGILCMSGSSPTIRNCIISDCEGVQGAGMACNAASPTIIECTFSDNGFGHGFDTYEGGGLHCLNASPSISRCVFSHNDSFFNGGGLSANGGSSLTITDCEFIGNGSEFGGAISCLNNPATISNCRFVNNDVKNGGGAISLSFGPAIITGCVFVGNGGASDAGVSAEVSDLTIRSCTFVRSQSPGVSLVGIRNGELTLENTIIAFNDGTAVTCASGGTATLSCCDVFGNTGGDWVGCIAGQQGIRGNFAADPLFCDLPEDDVRLSAGSPCLPGFHPQGEPCGLIGALGEGCGGTAVQPTTWGSIKAAFRR